MSDIYTWNEVLESGELDGYNRTLLPIHEMFTKDLVCENECNRPLVFHAFIKHGDRAEIKTYFECSLCGNTKEF